MTGYNHLPRVPLGIYPTPFYKLEQISAQYGRDIYIKRDDLCGVALGGNKVRKLEYLLAKAKADGCDTVFTTGGAQSNHAMLTAACASRLGMKTILLLKDRGVTGHLGNLVLDEIYGAQVRMIDTDDYQDIYREMDRLGAELAAQGHKCCPIPVGGSTALGAIGYVHCVEELAAQVPEGVTIDHIVSATGSGGTTAGLLLGAKRYLPDAKVTGIGVDDDPFEEIVPRLAAGAAELLGWDLSRRDGDFEMVYHVGPGYAIPNPEDTPYIRELARTEGILLDPVYTGKAWAGMLRLLKEGHFPGDGPLAFVHTGGAAALFAMDLPEASK
ncbi:1-aminocyclopropane-1-carboxylate deaminase/D-cysteine desulfhydrase [Dysosmobacter sp.]|uniref:1-aminocyclopropane-1-carboxylate deaminase/D-cysteine desulfhydrase n=1 Tax=Dysosmobacter sp. TaxID=2591382 RepID=UPI003A8FBE6C